MYRVLAGLLKSRGWDYVSAIYSDDMGPGFQSFAAAGSSNNLCLGSSTRLPPVATANDIDGAVADVQQAFFSRVVVLFTNPGETLQVLEAARVRGVLGQYLWVIANPDHSAKTGMDSALSSLPANSRFTVLSLELRTTGVPSFANYTASTRYDSNNAQRNNNGIPRQWFEEFYQNIHQCYLEDALERASFSTMCTKTEVILPSMVTQDRFLLNTLAAVDAMVHGIRLVCPSSSASSDRACLQQASSRGLILNATLAVSRSLNSDLPLPASQDSTFNLNFNSQRFWEQGFRIKKSTYDTTTSPKHDPDEIGTWAGQFTFDEASFPTVVSQCPQDAACACVQVTTQNAPTDSGPRRPLEPRNYFLYADDVTLVKTYTWPVWAIVVAVFTCIGLLLAILAFFFLLISYPIKGGTTVLAFLSQLGIMGIYAISFAFFVQASEASCGARRFVMGVVYAIVFACLLVKAIDNWRHRDSAYSNHVYSGVTSSLALLLFAIGIVLVQVIIPIMWLILVPPGAEWMGPATGIQHDWWWCTPTHFYDVGLVLSFLFVICLVIVTAIFAAMAWDCPANMYESRWILYSSICTAGCFLVWMIVTTNAGPPYRDACVTIANVVNATCLLITGPLRKIVLLYQVRADEAKATERHEYQEEYLYSNTAFDPDADYGYQQESKAGSDVGF